MSIIIDHVDVIAESVTTYNTVSASMFTFYDYLLTFGDEVDLIWRAELSWVSMLYYTIRYLTFFIRLVHLVFCTNVFGMVPVSAAGCLLWQWFQVMSGQVLFVAVEILLITRVFAYYGRSKVLLICLLSLLAAEFAAMFALVATSLPKAVIVSNPLRNIHAGPCVGISVSSLFSSLWIPPLIMQSILSILVAKKFIKSRLDAQADSPPILVVFIRDHTWAFVLIFAVSLWATLAYATINQGEVALTWNYSVLGFCGSRLILNLRSAASDVTSTSVYEESDIRFTSNLGSRTSRGVMSGVAAMEAKKEGLQI